MEHDAGFAHLHTHSEYSRLDGLGTMEHLVSSARSLGFARLGLTDHGTLAGVLSFTEACKREGIKPLLGMEGYMSLGGDSERFHITLLADGQHGFSSLIKLNNIAQKGEDKTRPVFKIDDLIRLNDGLIVLTGCPASPLQKLEWNDAKKIGLRLKESFEGRIFAEVQFIASGTSPWERSIKIAKDLHLPPILTNDAHFPLQSDALAHNTLTKLKAAFEYDSSALFLATPMELRARVNAMAPSFVPFFEKALANASRLADGLSIVEFSATPKLPTIEKSDEILSNTALQALKSKFAPAEPPKEYSERMQLELNTINSKGFSTYFLILQDIIKYARAHGVRIGPGRGSGAGSLVVYLLGITTNDPVRYNLSFDRFLNYKRSEMPDIDTDIESERRGIVMEYAKNRWGALPVATYNRYSHKSLVHELSRLFKVNKELDNKAADGGDDSEDFQKFLGVDKKISIAYNTMLGQVHHIGQHAGGVVIVDKSVEIPLERTPDGESVVAWTEGENRELTLAGVVKFDLLGLTALSILRRLEELVPGVRPSEPKDDDPIFEMFRTGDTTGVFQFSGSQAILDFTKNVAPRTFEDLVAINALFRPGAIGSGALDFPKYRKSPRKLHPFIDDILSTTYGVMCYQEQMMAIFARVTGQDMAGADLARKVIVKAKPGDAVWEEKVRELKKTFLEGADRNKIEEPLAQQIWEEISKHTKYSFNRAHAVTYTSLAWEMAWWKHNYPVLFYASSLSVDRDEWQRYLFEVVSKGIKVVPPSINTSTQDFVGDVKTNTLYLPLSVVKNLGNTGVEAILKLRPFSSLEDFMLRVPKRALTKRPREGLYQLGAFDGIPGDPSVLDVDITRLTDNKALQLKYLGFSLPTLSLIDRIKKAEKGGYIAGIVSEENDKESVWGKYKVWRFLPYGSCWHRGSDKPLKVGDEVRVKVDKRNGKLLNVASL